MSPEQALAPVPPVAERADIIDRNGIIRRKVVGNPDWSNPEIRAFLRTM